MTACEKPSQWSYRKGCRCDACKEIHTKAARDRRARRDGATADKPALSSESRKQMEGRVRRGQASICPVCGAFTTRDEGMCVDCEKRR